MIKLKLVWAFLGLLFVSPLAAQPSFIYEGGDGNGYATVLLNTDNTYLVEGNPGDGYASEVMLESSDYLMQGNPGDGYALQLYLEPFIWTGSVGTSWTVKGNWNYNLLPGIYRPVIIPSGVPNWPFINAGVFNIGDNPNNGAYKCASLWIQQDAQLVTRVNNKVENYGVIVIDGTMQIKNQSTTAFQNLSEGEITISGGGELIIKP